MKADNKFQIGDTVEFESIGGKALGRVEQIESNRPKYFGGTEYLVARYGSGALYYCLGENLRYIGPEEIAGFVSI